MWRNLITELLSCTAFSVEISLFRMSFRAFKGNPIMLIRLTNILFLGKNSRLSCSVTGIAPPAYFRVSSVSDMTG